MTIYQPSRGYHTRVRSVTRLSPTFLRVTLHDPELEHFGVAGPDQRIKIVLPRADGVVPDVGIFDEPRPSLMDWYTRWRQLPDAERNPIRTYTARAARPHMGEVDLDFVLHGRGGPASGWAMDVKVGDELIIVGPDARSDAAANRGVEWHPGRAGRVLIVGDETAVPAISAILESLPAQLSGDAYIEVPHAEDCLPVASASAVRQHWLPRGDAAVGTLLVPAVHAWGEAHRGSVAAVPPVAVPGVALEADLSEPSADEVLWDVSDQPDAEFYAWLAGEANIITSLRRHLVRGLEIDRKAVAFMGYWRHGRPES